MIITFDSIGNGGLAEQFRMALAQVGRNLMNPNMDPKKERKITVEIVFKPTGGGAIDTTYHVRPGLAGFAKASTTFLIGQDARSGKIQMSEYGSGSQPMRIDSDPQMTQAETINPRPVQPFDPDTGEIYEAQTNQGPIDLRKAQ